MTSPDPSTRYRDQLIETLRTQVLDTINPSEAVKQSVQDLKATIFDRLSDISEKKRIGINFSEQNSIAQELVNDIVGLGPLEALLSDPDINDILVNGYDSVYVERNGTLEKADCRFRDANHLMNVARRIVSRIGRRIDESNPMVDARLADGSRVNIIAPPLARSGVCLSIRKFPEQRINLDGILANGGLNLAMAEFLKTAVKARLNIIISGGTGSGKTTMLNSLSNFIHDHERVITIEDAAELQLQQEHVISLETRGKSIESTGEITQRDLVKNALRMRPDRIILGEVRGEEIFDMMQAMNTGHDGSMSTIHANTTQDALVRMESMFNMGTMDLSPQLIQRQIAGSIDLIVQIERSLDGKRRVIDIAEIYADEQGRLASHSLFKFHAFDETSSAPVYRQPSTQLKTMDKFQHMGHGNAVQQILG